MKLESRAGKLAIDGSFRIGTSGCADPRAGAAAGRLFDRIARQTGIPMMGEPAVKLTVECAARGPEYPTLGEDESYTLEVAAQGRGAEGADRRRRAARHGDLRAGDRPGRYGLRSRPRCTSKTGRDFRGAA